MADMEIVGRGDGVEEYPSRDLHHQTSGCSAPQQEPQPMPAAPHHTRQQGAYYATLLTLFLVFFFFIHCYLETLQHLWSYRV